MPSNQESIAAASTLKGSFVAVIVGVFTLLFLRSLYRLYLHPLHDIPSPPLASASSIYLYIICYLGIEGRVLRHHHVKYNTNVLRVAPNSVSISDSNTVREIYIARGGFQKDSRYQNFDLGDVVTIFSATDTEYHNRRAKAVAPLFAPPRLREASEPNGAIGKCVAEFVQQILDLKAAALAGRRRPGTFKVDILDLCARLSIDVVTGYLLDKRFGGLREHVHLPIEERRTTKLSANPFIFAIVAFSRFSLLPNWLFRIVYSVSSRMGSSEEAVRAFLHLETFAKDVVETVNTKSSGGERGRGVGDTYQGRLLGAGVSPYEAKAQSEAIVFAGADSTAVMLATTLFRLVQDRGAQIRLLNELRKDNSLDPQSLPYMRAVIKEGLRLGMANPVRFTRVVGGGGLRVGHFHIRPGVVVGCAPYVLHHDEKVFPDPFAFRPERWLEDGQDEGLRRPNMEKGLIPFGVGSRACIGKNLAQQQLFEGVKAVVESGALEGARTCEEQVEMVEWFNGEITGHKLDIEWLVGS